LIKKYLRDLPEPIFPESLYPAIRRCPMPSDDPGDVAAVTYVRESLLPLLPHCAYILLSYVLHLMHEVCIRAGTNKMDAKNLTIVLGPNLVKSASPLRDVQMCAVSSKEPTLGTVLRLCIQRYYECFEDVPDRGEAVAALAESTSSASLASSASLSDGALDHTRAGDGDEDEDIDDAMLVMPLGPGSPSAAQTTFKTPHRTGASRSSTLSAARSLHAAPADGSVRTAGMGTVGKSRARSLVSVERAGPPGSGSRSGSIAVGRGTVRGKASGAGVSAIGVTASGFFTAPREAPPVPSLPP
jgi:Rho GTPase-activating protein 1